MQREEVIEKLRNYFKKQELVGKDVYYYYTAREKDPWTVLDTQALHCLLITRILVDKPFTVNDWHKGGIYDERGHRANVQDILYNKTINLKIYLSSHILGKGFDFKVKGMDSDDVRDLILKNAELYPFKIRLENKILRTDKTITWVHIDVIWDINNPQVYLFNV